MTEVVALLAEHIMSYIIQRIIPDTIYSMIRRRSENGGGGAFLAEVFDTELQERSKEDMVDKAKQLLMILGSVVMEVKGRQVTNGPLLQWLGEVVEGMYQGQYMVDIMKHQSNSSISYEDKRELLNLVNKLEDLNSKLDLFFKFLKRCDPLDPNVTNYLNMDDDRLFGRMVEKATIINFLLPGKDNSGCSWNVDVLTITGAEGVGKSALVEYFYKETWVRNHYSQRVWLKNASLHDPAPFIKEFLNQFSSNNVATEDDAEQMLTDKTFLLVIDNASDIDERVWTVIKAYLEYGKKGSKVIITSRKDEATDLGTIEPIILDTMPKGEYSSFLKKIVFGRSRPQEYAKLAKIAKEIANLLNGYPLAATVMADRLRENINIQHWENILKTLKPAGADSRDNSSTSNNPSSESWLRMELMWRNFETSNRAATEANLRTAILENQVTRLTGLVESMKEMQQSSDLSRPKKKARLISTEPQTIPSSQHPSMVRREDAGPSCSYQNNGPEEEIASALNGKEQGYKSANDD